jgi:hypothetical protein
MRKRSRIDWKPAARAWGKTIGNSESHLNRCHLIALDKDHPPQKTYRHTAPLATNMQMKAGSVAVFVDS